MGSWNLDAGFQQMDTQKWIRRRNLEVRNFKIISYDIGVWVIDNVFFFQQGAKLKVQNLKDPPFVTKLDPIIGSDGYDMEGPIPDIWFALQVGSITIDTFESI